MKSSFKVVSATLDIYLSFGLCGFESRMPSIRDQNISESSVTCPAPTKCGPPPSISMQFLISSGVAGVVWNSKYEPMESPMKVPRMQPYAQLSYDYFGTLLMAARLYLAVCRIFGVSWNLQGGYCSF